MPTALTPPTGPVATTVADLRDGPRRYDAEAKLASLATPRYRLDSADWGDPARPTVVFVHGMADQMKSFCLVQARLVDAGFRCVSYELADGYHDGASLSHYGHPEFVADLFALLDHLKLRSVDLVGASFGSTVALKAAVTQPGRFRRVVLQGGFARRPLNSMELALATLGGWLPGRMEQLPMRRKMMTVTDAPQFVGTPPEALAFLDAMGGRTPVKAAAHRGMILRDLDLRPDLPRVTQPVLMIGGDRDTIVPRSCEAEVEAGVPDVRRVEIAPCGHYPQYTCPATMATLIAEFLRPG